MLVRFLRDYRGPSTGENLYRAGEEGSFGPGEASLLIEEGVAEAVNPAPPKKKAPAPAPAKGGKG